MHRQIRSFPSGQFYQKKITDHSSINTRKLPDTIQELEKVVGVRFVFIDITDS